MLHKQWSGDTSAKVTLFSREFGLVHCLCKGGRTPKKHSLLQPFLPLWVSVKGYYTQSVESLASAFYFQGMTLFSALYVNELLYHVLRPELPEPELFDAYLATLEGLALGNERLHIESVLRRFEWAVLKACGHSFSFTQEASGALIQTQNRYHFVAGEGFLNATQGIPGEHLLALAEDKLDSKACLQSAKVIMRQAIAHLLGDKKLHVHFIMTEL